MSSVPLRPSCLLLIGRRSGREENRSTAESAISDVVEAKQGSGKRSARGHREDARGCRGLESRGRGKSQGPGGLEGDPSGTVSSTAAAGWAGGPRDVGVMLDAPVCSRPLPPTGPLVDELERRTGHLRVQAGPSHRLRPGGSRMDEARRGRGVLYLCLARNWLLRMLSPCSRQVPSGEPASSSAPCHGAHVRRHVIAGIEGTPWVRWYGRTGNRGGDPGACPRTSPAISASFTVSRTWPWLKLCRLFLEAQAGRRTASRCAADEGPNCGRRRIQRFHASGRCCACYAAASWGLGPGRVS